MRLILLSIFAYGVYNAMQRVIEENSGESILALPSPKSTPQKRRASAAKKRAR